MKFRKAFASALLVTVALLAGTASAGGVGQIVGIITQLFGAPISQSGVPTSGQVLTMGSGGSISFANAAASGFGAQTANTSLSGPTSGGSAVPTFRALVAADIPSLPASQIGSGQLAVAQGGTAVATATANTLFTGPTSGGAAAPAFRAMVAADLGTTLAPSFGLVAATGIGVSSTVANAAAGASAGDYRVFDSSNNWTLRLNATALDYLSTGATRWCSSTTALNSVDAQISRSAPGVLQFGTSSANAAGSFLATGATMTGATSTATLQMTVHASATGTTTIDATATFWPCDTTSAAFTITLPTAVGISGRIYHIKKTDLTANGTVTVATTSSQTIDGSTTYAITTRYQILTVISDGSNWHIL